MATYAVLKDWADRFNVTPEDQLDALLDYVDQQQDGDAFNEYCEYEETTSTTVAIDAVLDYIDRQDSDDALADALHMYAITHDWFGDEHEEEG
jgi:hypothetical protein